MTVDHASLQASPGVPTTTDPDVLAVLGEILDAGLVSPMAIGAPGSLARGTCQATSWRRSPLFVHAAGLKRSRRAGDRTSRRRRVLSPPQPLHQDSRRHHRRHLNAHRVHAKPRDAGPRSTSPLQFLRGPASLRPHQQSR